MDTNFDRLLRVSNTLDPFQDDGAVPVLLQEFDIFPRMAEARKDGASPFGGGSVEIVLNILIVLGFEV